MAPDPVRGVAVDARTRCRHYGSERDVVAVRFPCCGEYYACYECHAERADHDAERWPADAREERAVLCGACGTELTIRAYLDSGHTCPECGSAFDPGCANHYPLYFEGDDEDGEGGGFSSAFAMDQP